MEHFQDEEYLTLILQQRTCTQYLQKVQRNPPEDFVTPRLQIEQGHLGEPEFVFESL